MCVCGGECALCVVAGTGWGDWDDRWLVGWCSWCVAVMGGSILIPSAHNVDTQDDDSFTLSCYNVPTVNDLKHTPQLCFNIMYVCVRVRHKSPV